MASRRSATLTELRTPSAARDKSFGCRMAIIIRANVSTTSSIIAGIRCGRFESLSKELEKGMRIMTGEHVVRSVHFSTAAGRNPYDRHIAADAFDLADSIRKRKVVQFGVNYDHINVRKSTQKP